MKKSKAKLHSKRAASVTSENDAQTYGSVDT